MRGVINPAASCTTSGAGLRMNGRRSTGARSPQARHRDLPLGSGSAATVSPDAVEDIELMPKYRGSPRLIAICSRPRPHVTLATIGLPDGFPAGDRSLVPGRGRRQSADVTELRRARRSRICGGIPRRACSSSIHPTRTGRLRSGRGCTGAGSRLRLRRPGRREVLCGFAQERSPRPIARSRHVHSGTKVISMDSRPSPHSKSVTMRVVGAGRIGAKGTWCGR